MVTMRNQLPHHQAVEFGSRDEGFGWVLGAVVSWLGGPLQLMGEMENDWTYA